MKVIAFDCFGTVFDASSVPAHDVQSYVRQVKRAEWTPLDLPSAFLRLAAHEDAEPGIARLRKKFRVVTCSNLPLWLLFSRSEVANIRWDAIVPLEASRTYKPHWQAYQVVCHSMQVKPSDVLVVTAHADGPDINGAPEAGMKVQLIRNTGSPQTIIELAESLNC